MKERKKERKQKSFRSFKHNCAQTQIVKIARRSTFNLVTVRWLLYVQIVGYARKILSRAK